MSLVDKEYDFEDSNLKFLLALREKWDLEEMSLDEIYGMLNTHKLEMEQRNKRHGGKSKSIAIKAEEKVPTKAVVKKSHSKGKGLILKYDNESSNFDNDSNSENS